MVRVHGPLYSQTASGQFASHLIYRQAGRDHTVYPHFKPHQPHTKPQTSHRAMFGFLMRAWPELTSTERQTWEALVPLQGPSPHQAYLAHNLLRWTHFQTPLRQYPKTPYPGPRTPEIDTATGGPRYIDWLVDAGRDDPPWAFILYRQTAPYIQPAHNNATHIAIYPGTRYWTCHDDHLTPGTYWAKIAAFDGGGEIAISSFEESATAT